MHTILAATLVVRVLGLATVTDQVPNDCGVHVIVPRVEYHAHAGQTAPQVEDHTAMLAVEKKYYDPASTWAMTPIKAFPNYLFVRLDGDPIRVLTDGINPAPNNVSRLALPSLKGCCTPAGALKKLRSEFQAPYTGAAAVLDVPAGKVNACRAPGKGTDYRYDMEIVLNYVKSARISGDTMKERKEIRLRNLPLDKPGVVYLANMPSCFLDGTCTTKLATEGDGLAHVHAYYAMLEGDTSKCQKSMKSCPRPGNPSLCSTPMIGGGMQAMSFECSNTKYP
jgi:hypothetical protein